MVTCFIVFAFHFFSLDFPVEKLVMAKDACIILSYNYIATQKKKILS